MKKIGLLICLFIAFACSNDDDGSTQNNTFAYKGVWNGTYEGAGDTGTFTATVEQDGTINGTVTSNTIEDYNMIINGMVNEEGALTATLKYQTEQIGTFTGTLIKTSDTGTGTWTTTYMGFSFSGTWSGTKE